MSAATYIEVDDELSIFEGAARSRLPVMLKGPTGCGKTRLVEHMAARLQRPLFTVACHEDLTASDLVGRYLLRGGDTVWEDGPLTRAVREGGICYLDEIVEARADTTVVLHPLLDHRRVLHIDRLGEVLPAPDDFMLVVSYNPGYQSVLKDLKPSTRQRMVSIALGHPPESVELAVLTGETGVEPAWASDLVRLGQAIRALSIEGMPEAASTRALVSAARLTVAGISPRRAALAAIALPLGDDPSVVSGLTEMIATYLPE